MSRFALLYSVSIMSNAVVGYSFEEASAFEAVARSEKPRLFIHSIAYDFIPLGMMGRIYDTEAMNSKEMFIAESAGHTEAMYEPSDAYWAQFPFRQSLCRAVGFWAASPWPCLLVS